MWKEGISKREGQVKIKEVLIERAWRTLRKFFISKIKEFNKIIRTSLGKRKVNKIILNINLIKVSSNDINNSIQII